MILFAHTMAENDPRPPALPLFSLDSASPLSVLDSAQPGSLSMSNFEFHDDEIDALLCACASSFDEPAVESSTKRLGKRKFGPSKSDNDGATAQPVLLPFQRRPCLTPSIVLESGMNGVFIEQ